MNRDHARAVSMLQVRCKYLEGENNTLLQRLDSVSRQKHNLDRMVKEYQSERSKEVSVLSCMLFRMESLCAWPSYSPTSYDVVYFQLFTHAWIHMGFSNNCNVESWLWLGESFALNWTHVYPWLWLITLWLDQTESCTDMVWYFL